MLLLTKESRRLVSRRYSPSTREFSNSSLVSGSDFKKVEVSKQGVLYMVVDGVVG